MAEIDKPSEKEFVNGANDAPQSGHPFAAGFLVGTLWRLFRG